MGNGNGAWGIAHGIGSWELGPPELGPPELGVKKAEEAFGCGGSLRLQFKIN